MRYFLPVLFLFLLGCAASKKAEDVDPAPRWVKNRPVLEGYYIGIGSARMVGMKQEYVAEARKNALQDMASQISAHVSSTSVLNTIENAYGVSESYSERVEIESENYLEGFEPVDYYESENQYWVYYKIREDVYRKNKLRKRDEALTAALSKYRSGRREAEAGCPMEAMAFCLQGMAALKAFLGKDLTIHVHSSEETIDVGNELLALLKKVISRMDIAPVDKEVEVKRGSKLANPLEFRIIYNDKAVEGVPVALNYSGGYLKSGLKQTDEKGRVAVSPGRVTSGKNRETLTAHIDHESIAAHAVSDVFIRSILKNIPSAAVRAEIHILSPILDVKVSSEDTLPGYDEKIRELCNRKAERYHLTTLGKDEIPDYSLDIDYRFEPGETAGGLTSAYLTSELRFTDEQGNVIASEIIEDIKGVGHTSSEASKQAFETFTRKLDRRYIDRMLEERF